jgi:hypothetical protein
VIGTNKRAQINSIMKELTSGIDETAAQLDLVRNPVVLWQPLPGPQTLAYNSPADELFYGGAAGGGKSDLILGLASTAHHKTLILRREGTQLEELIERSHELFDGFGSFNGSKQTWSNLPGGRKIEMHGVPHEHDKKRYQGRAHDLKAFDEATEFTPTQYNFIIGWNRSTRKNQRSRVLLTGNPPTTPEGEWIVQYFAPWLDEAADRPANPGELRWYTVIDGEEREFESGKPFTYKGEEYQPRSRTFVPARLTDNPILARTGYRAVLQSMPEPLRSQMLYGDFKAKPGSDPWQVIPGAWIDAAFERWRKISAEQRKYIESFLPTQLGADIARGGKAQTVIARRFHAPNTGIALGLGEHFHYFSDLRIFPGSETPDSESTVKHIFEAIAPGAVISAFHANGLPINIDAIGVGSAVYDKLTELGMNVSGINFGQPLATEFDDTGRLRLINIRALAYWRFREALEPTSKFAIALPPSRSLKIGLTAPHWSLTPQGIKIEPKEDVVKRTGLTLDEADAVVLSWLKPIEQDWMQQFQTAAFGVYS